MTEGVVNPASVVGKDTTTGLPTPTDQTAGDLHTRDDTVVARMNALSAAASVDVNDGITADVDAAVAAATGLRLMGYACRESDGTPAGATFRIIHGATASGGTVVVPVELAANESKSQWFGPDGIDVASGISIDWIVGTVDVELFHKTVA